MKPLIGITSFVERKPRGEYVSLNEGYAYSVAAAGGIPVILPEASESARDDAAREYAARDYAGRLDGMLFSGGADVSPLRYGEAVTRHIGLISSARDEWELALFVAAMEFGLPLLGICRGHQVINVAMGGTLYQDIPSQVPEALGHSSEMSTDEPCHYVDILDEGSALFAAFGERRILTNSFHHQAVKDLAPGLIATARAADGIIEGFEAREPGRFIMGLQFHPEGLTRRYPEFLAPFAALVQAAATRHTTAV